MARYVHQNKNWPKFYWEQQYFMDLLTEVSKLQGKLIGKIEMLGFELKEEANLETLILDVVRSAEIEGEILNPEQVRSSIALKLGLKDAGLPHSDRHIDGIVQMMIDATQNNANVIDADRLFSWHGALFPTGRSGLYQIEVAQWRTGEMQVVSGGMGREIIHFQAPSPQIIDNEMQSFFDWFNSSNTQDPIIKAALAHFWFVTIHPFDDGNGRIARAITDLQLSRADGVNQRFYSMSAQMMKERKAYYHILEKTQRGDLDLTPWIVWFLECLKNAIISSQYIIDRVVRKHQFWAENSALISNVRQQIILNKLLDHFEGNLTSSKWAKLAKCSADSALRDINDLVQKGILVKAASGGRSTHYTLKN